MMTMTNTARDASGTTYDKRAFLSREEKAPTLAVANDAIEQGEIEKALLVLSEIMTEDEAAMFVSFPIRPFAKVGDVLVSSWGYDQTNIDFYQVVAVSKSMIRIVKMGKRCVDDPADRGSRTTDSMMPVFDAHTLTNNSGVQKKLKVSEYGDGYYCNVDHSIASLWDGNPRQQTGWGYGH